jgi:hypothetical protein
LKGAEDIDRIRDLTAGTTRVEDVSGNSSPYDPRMLSKRECAPWIAVRTGVGYERRVDRLYKRRAREGTFRYVEKELLIVHQGELNYLTSIGLQTPRFFTTAPRLLKKLIVVRLEKPVPLTVSRLGCETDCTTDSTLTESPIGTDTALLLK